MFKFSIGNLFQPPIVKYIELTNQTSFDLGIKNLLKMFSENIDFIKKDLFSFKRLSHLHPDNSSEEINYLLHLRHRKMRCRFKKKEIVFSQLP